MTKAQWTTRGFEAFRRGTFGNGGQNLFVSRAGVLQRIHQYDLNGDGHFDLVFCNSQSHWERVPTYVYRDVLGQADRVELPAEGAMAGAVADLNGDGFDDLVLGCHMNGVTTAGLNALIYYGSDRGWGEWCQQQLPAPDCTAVAVGDFNGDGRADIAFVCNGKLRLFYQSELGFEPKRFVDVAIDGDSLAAHDLDGDGSADLVVRSRSGAIHVYWGGPDGIDPDRRSAVLVRTSEGVPSTNNEASALVEYTEDAHPLVKIVLLDRPHVVAPGASSVQLVPVLPDRRFGPAMELNCQSAMSIAAGDINGDGFKDLVLACRATNGDGEYSLIYWGSVDGYDDGRRTVLKSHRACDVAVGDLDGDGRDEIVICQNRTHASYTSQSLVYRGDREGVISDPVRLLTHDARAVFIARPGPHDEHGPRVVLVNHFSRSAVDDVKTSIYFGGPDGYSKDRRHELATSGAVEAISADINDDGFVDLVFANASEYTPASADPGSFAFLNGPGGFEDRPRFIFPTIHAHGVCCADLNRDGYLDLIFAGFGNSEMHIYYGAPGGFDVANPVRIRMERDGVVYNEPRWMVLADLNNDGYLDLVVPQIGFDRSFILWGGPDGFSMERLQFLSVFSGACARAADLTGNGYLDLIIGGHRQSEPGPKDSFVYIYWNGPDGLREDRRMLLPAETVNTMTLADFNGDGRLDLFVGSYASTRERDLDSYIYWNRAGRGFSAGDRTRLFMHSVSGCVAADFNEDGHIDLAVANHKVWGDHMGDSWVLWNSSNGFDTSRVTPLPTRGPHGMTCVGVGNIADRGADEYYVSEPHEMSDGARVTGISWQATVPAKTWVKGQLRTAGSRAQLEQAAWTGPDGQDSWYDNGAVVGLDTKPWVQYRLALGATNSLGTPRLTEVVVEFDAN